MHRVIVNAQTCYWQITLLTYAWLRLVGWVLGRWGVGVEEWWGWGENSSRLYLFFYFLWGCFEKMSIFMFICKASICIATESNYILIDALPMAYRYFLHEWPTSVINKSDWHQRSTSVTDIRLSSEINISDWHQTNIRDQHQWLTLETVIRDQHQWLTSASNISADISDQHQWLTSETNIRDSPESTISDQHQRVTSVTDIRDRHEGLSWGTTVSDIKDWC